MKKKHIIGFAAILAAAFACTNEGKGGGGASIAAVDFTKVRLSDNFWAPRIKVNTEVTIPHALEKCESEGRFANFRRAAGMEEGLWQGHWGFDDSDVYKVLEGMAYTYNVSHDRILHARMDSIVSLIAAAQCEDGYLYTALQLKAKDYLPVWCTYKEGRYDNLKQSHEFYNMGHLYEAAAAHFTATGQRNLLDVALKSADHIYDNFGPGGKAAIPGHQEIELGLVKLSRITGNPKYTELAELFLDRRGTGIDDGDAYYQNDEPVTQQRYARGHAVRANYMYSAMTDIAILSGNKEYTDAVDSLWEDVVSRRMYVTGGMGSLYDGEAYGPDYELPNASYCETCAAIAGIYWNHRMFLLHGESKYVDVLERILYNAMPAGVSLDGEHFFYPNPMIADGVFRFNRSHCGRTEWFDCSCCPTNDVRFISSVPGYVYAVGDGVIYENLYAASEADVTVNGISVRLVQKTDYPWDGHVSTEIRTRGKAAKFELRLRIPMWAKGKPLPGGLYSYVDSRSEEIPVRINGEAVEYSMKDGYASITRKWRDGDCVEIDFPMPVREVTADPRVKADEGLEALERGPIVYCFEQADNGEVVKASGEDSPEAASASEILISRDSAFSPAYNEDLLGGVMTLTDGTLTAIPYCLWDNRSDGQMTVWIKQKATNQTFL